MILTEVKQVAATSNASISVLTPPTLTNPSNNSGGISTSPNLGWVASSGATSYRVFVGTSMGTWNVHNGANVSLTNFTTYVFSGSTYYWTVSACDLLGQCSTKAPVWSFTTTGSSTLVDLVPDNFTFTNVLNASP